ncbi:MAG TPA: hypothetical protein VG756_05685 [Pseudonocardiaceae bacterium]|nr:hypothetical protein [Pseudonocardiaceae bacterium]
MGDNEPGRQPPEDWDADQVRQFQEFQRFQAYLRFTQSQQEADDTPPSGLPSQPGEVSGQPGVPGRPGDFPGQPGGFPGPVPGAVPGMPMPPGPGGELVPTGGNQPVPGQPPGGAYPPGQLEAQLSDMRAQLARIERAANPPWWKKLLRSRLVHWVIVLIVLAAIGFFVVPAVVNHYFGAKPAPGGAGAALPAPKTESGELPKSPNDTVGDLYLFVAGNNADNACFLFDTATAAHFATAFHAPTCPAAITALNKQATDPTAYGYPNLSLLPEARPGQVSTTIDSCQFTVSGGPRLGTFALTRQSDGGWEITGYTAQSECPQTTVPATQPTS